jgi:hypothetical protein
MITGNGDVGIWNTETSNLYNGPGDATVTVTRSTSPPIAEGASATTWTARVALPRLR